MSQDNYYELFQIDRGADADSISVILREQRKKFSQLAGHPNAERRRMGEERMEQLDRAEDVLLDPAARQAYDASLDAQPVVAEAAPQKSDLAEIAAEYYNRGDARNALLAADRAIIGNPDSLSAYMTLAYAAIDLKDYPKADFASSELVRRVSNSADAWGLRGDVLDAERRYREAEAAYQQAFTLEPEKLYWYGRVIWAVSDQGRGDQAMTMAQQLIERDPTNEYSKKVYANMRIYDADAKLSVPRPGKLIIASKKQVEYYDQALAAILMLQSKDQSVIDMYNRNRTFVDNAKKKKYKWGGFLALVLAVLAIVFFFVGLANLPAGLLWVLFAGGLGYLFFLVCWKPQWKRNYKLLSDAAKKTGIR